MPKRRSKNTKALEAITSKLEAATDIQAGQEEQMLVTASELENISVRVAKIVGVVARASTRIKQTEQHLDEVDQKIDVIEEQLAEQSEPSEESKPVVSDTTAHLSSIALSMQLIGVNLGIVENLLTKSLEGQKQDQYKQEEAALETKAPTATPGVKREGGEKGSSFLDSLKNLFTNPVIIAAFSGLAYLLLPKDVKEKIGAFFTGFMKSGEKVDRELSTFEKGLIGAALGLSTYLGAAVMKSIGDAITSILSLIASAKGGIKALKNKGVGGVAKDVGKAAIAKAPQIAIGVGAAAGVASAMADEKPEGEKPKTSTPPPTPAPATGTQQVEAPAVAGTGLKPGGGEGLKPGGGVGIKMPSSTIGDAIKDASKRVGVDESIMLAVARQESGFNPQAKASTSSAKGLYQFIDATWGGMVSKYGSQYPELAKGPLDPQASAIAGALYIKENARSLEKNGIPVNATNIYASHFLGAGGARKLLTADPNIVAAEIFPREAAANKPIFFNKDGTPRTISDIINVLYGKVGRIAESYAAALSGSPDNQMAKMDNTPQTTGVNISRKSESVESSSTAPATSITTNVAGGTRGLSTEKGPQAPSQIPTPIANRGSLGVGVRHSTATA